MCPWNYGLKIAGLGDRASRLWLHQYVCALLETSRQYNSTLAVGSISESDEATIELIGAAIGVLKADLDRQYAGSGVRSAYRA